MIRLCVFDLDGTTVDSLNSIAHFANETLRAFGFPAFSVDAYRHLAGGGAKKLMANLVAALGAPESLCAPMRADWLKRYEANFLYLTRAYPGVTDMLAALRAMGVRTAILTNKRREIAEKICGELFGTDGRLLDAVISEHEGMTLKPAPDELWRLMDRFNCPKAACAYVGDHTLDMETGKNAGVTTVGVVWGFHTRQALLDAGADYVAERPADITELIKTLNTMERGTTT